MDISTGITLGLGVLEFIDRIRGIEGSDVISALFDSDCKTLEGNERIKVTKHPGGDGIWWYSVDELTEYTFIHFPVIQSGVYEILGKEEGQLNPDTKYWRWVANAMQGRIYGGGTSDPNALVNFIVIGYKARALIKRFSS